MLMEIHTQANAHIHMLTIQSKLFTPCMGTQNAQNYGYYPATMVFLECAFLTTNKMVHILETVCV